MERIRMGLDLDGRAVEELYRRHAPMALRFAHRLSRDPGLSEDLAAEAFLKSWQRLAAGNCIHSFKSYVLRAVRNIYVDLLRRRVRLVSLEVTPEMDLRAMGLDDLGETVEFGDIDLLRSAWMRINPRYRLALWLHVVEGYSLSELAEILGASYNAAAVVVHRARRSLGAAYDQLQEPRLAG